MRVFTLFYTRHCKMRVCARVCIFAFVYAHAYVQIRSSCVVECVLRVFSSFVLATFFAPMGHHQRHASVISALTSPHLDSPLVAMGENLCYLKLFPTRHPTLYLPSRLTFGCHGIESLLPYTLLPFHPHLTQPVLSTYLWVPRDRIFSVLDTRL